MFLDFLLIQFKNLRLNENLYFNSNLNQYNFSHLFNFYLVLYSCSVMDLVKQLAKNPFLLAPMAGVTDHAFRSFMKALGVHIVFTELVSAHGIKYKNEATLNLLKFSKTQSPIGVQIFGEDPQLMGQAAFIVEQMGYDFVDLNFGCPVKKIVKKGAGSAILRDMNQLGRILNCVKSSIKIPLTIKIRTGWDENSKNASQVCDLAYNEGVTWVTIHGRTRSQGYSGKADWDYIQQTKQNSQIPIIGNGDITTPRQAVDNLIKSQCDGVMIGRGCLKRPWIFKQALHLHQNKERTTFDTNPMHIIHILYHHLADQLEQQRVLLQMKKFVSWFSSGYANSSVFRQSVFQIKDVDQLMNHCQIYFEKIKGSKREDEANFMMAGHG